VALVRTDVSEECIFSIIRVTRIGELGTILEVTSNRKHAAKRRFSQEPYRVTYQKTAFFIVTAVKPPNLTYYENTPLSYKLTEGKYF
jgi:hypothetical protein